MRAIWEGSVRRHLAYLSYVVRHKWFVMIECFRHGLIWRGLVHDLSKFRPSEWFPYARHFYNRNGSKVFHRDNLGREGFDFAWLLHQKRNRHHWQWWILPAEEAGEKVLEMKPVFRTEMVCDWIGDRRAMGHGKDLYSWYKKNIKKMRFHPSTAWMVEAAVFHEDGE